MNGIKAARFVAVHVQPRPKLSEITEARNPGGGLTGAGQGGQKNADEQRDNPDDNQQFNEGKPAVPTTHLTIHKLLDETHSVLTTSIRLSMRLSLIDGNV